MPRSASFARHLGTLVSLGLVAMLSACSKPAPEEAPVRSVRLQRVVLGGAGASREYAGEVRARIESRLGFRVGGQIVQRRVGLGETVKPGQVLAELDPRDQKLGQASAQAAVTSAQASFDLAQADYHRYVSLRDQGFISAAELERHAAELKAARSQLDQARAQANVQGNQAGYTALKADAAGVVTGVDAEPGMVVAAGASIVRVAQDGPRDVVFSVPEDQVASLRAAAATPGALTVTLWGADASGAPLPATLREVSAAADPTTRTFLVKADIGRAAVRLGQTATVVLTLPSVPGVARVPLSALYDDKGGTAVWLVEPSTMTVRRQAVEVAGTDANEAVVSAGLSDGQQLVTAGVHVLAAGQKVKAYVDPRAPAASSATAAARAPSTPASARP